MTDAIVLTTPAELQSMREWLGLTRECFGARVGVKDRTVLRWETGDSPVTAAAAEAILTLWNDAAHQVSALVSEALKETDDVVTLETVRLDAFGGMPASWHRAIATRAMDQIMTHTMRTVRMVFVDE